MQIVHNMAIYLVALLAAFSFVLIASKILISSQRNSRKTLSKKTPQESRFFKRHVVVASKTETPAVTNDLLIFKTPMGLGLVVVCSMVFLFLIKSKQSDPTDQLTSEISSPPTKEKPLKKYITPDSMPSINELVDIQANDDLKTKLTLLRRNTPIYLYAPRSRIKELSVYHNTSLKGWKQFLKKHELNYTQIFSLLAEIKENGIIILPQLHYLNESQRKAIEDLHKVKNISFLFIGPAGLFDQNSKKLSWFDNLMQLNVKWTDIEGAHPITIRGEIPPYGHFPSGKTLQWFSYPLNYTFYSPLETSSAPSIGYDFSLEKSVDRKFEKIQAKHIVEENRRRAFINLDLPETKSLEKVAAFYAEYFITSTLYWLSGMPTVQIAKWKDGAKSPVLLQTDLPKISETNVPLTRLMTQNTPILKNISTPNQKVEILPEVSAPPSNNAEVLFDKLQALKRNLETKTKNSIYGASIQLGQLTPEVLEAVKQNELDYLQINHPYDQFSPMDLGNSTPLLLPWPETVDNNLSETLEKSTTLGGVVSARIRNNNIIQELEEIIAKEDLWATTPSEFSAWYKARKAISKKLEKEINEAIRFSYRVGPQTQALHLIIDEGKYVLSPTTGLVFKKTKRHDREFLVISGLKENQDINIRFTRK